MRTTKRILRRLRPTRSAIRRWWSRPHCVPPMILMYHGVVDRIRDEQLDRWCITTDRFRRQLDRLSRTGNFVSIRDMVDGLGAEQHDARPRIAITFDDGFANVRENAYPLLRERGIPFAVALPAGLMNTQRTIWSMEIDLIALCAPTMHLTVGRASESRRSFRLGTRLERQAVQAALRDEAALLSGPGIRTFVDDLIRQCGPDTFAQMIAEYKSLQLLSREAAREMVAGGMEPLVHGMLHWPLQQTDDMTLEQEIIQAKSSLEQALGLDRIDGFCYPFGAANDNAVRCVRHSGFRFALGATESGPLRPKCDCFRLPRVDASDPSFERALGRRIKNR